MATALTVAEVVLDLAKPWPLKIVVDNGLGDQPMTGWLAPFAGWSAVQLAAGGAVLIVIIAAASAVVSYLSTAIAGRAAERIGSQLRQQTVGTSLRLSMRYHDRHRSGELVNRLTSDVNRVVDAVVVWFSTVIPEALALVGMLVVLVLIDPLLALTAVLVAPLLGVFVVRRRNRVRTAQREARERTGALAATATDLLRHVRSVQAFHRFDEAGSAFGTRNRDAFESNVTALLIEARLRPTTTLVLAFGTGGVLLLGVARVSSGGLTLGSLLVVMSYLSGLYLPIRSLTRLNNTLSRGNASRDRLAEILDSDEEVPESVRAVSAPRPVRALVFEDVSFSYRTETPILEHLDLAVPAGRTVCIVGASGAGKSTILSLLLRLYDPSDGRIRIDFRDIRDCSLRSLRERVAYVPQDPWLLDGSVLENITYGQPGIEFSSVLEASRRCMVDDFVRRLPEGYDTQVGENGVLLSGGERRRLAIVRAVVRQADVLLLDEPTSGLDAASEAGVVAALRRASRGRTVLMVSHRLNLASLADEVVVLDGGRVVERGTPRELRARTDGAFARLWALQQSSAAPDSPDSPAVSTGVASVEPDEWRREVTRHEQEPA